jgi:hypothetical protein
VSLITRDLHKFVSMHPEKDLDGKQRAVERRD